MKTKDWVLVVASLLLAVLFDQITKSYSLTMTEKWVGPVHLVLIHNHGAMLGLFSNLPAFLRIVSLSTSGFFLLSIYCFLQYIIPLRIIKLRVGLSLLIGGIIGNVIDRTVYGYVIDFLSFQIKTWHSPVWNIADMIQWIGYILIVISLLKEGHLLWPDQNSRQTFWVNKKFQIKYAAVFMMTGLLLTIISLVFSYTYLRITLTEVLGHNPEAITKYTEAYLFSFLILVLAFSITLFIIAKIISHRIAGPVYAFERFLKDVLEGKGLTKTGQALKLRAGDDFIHLEHLAEKVREKLILLNSQKVLEVVEYSDEEKKNND
jgi:signal peptidase II